MLFDLRGRGRRNTIKVIYVTLALLMGGGLVLFGIGGNTSGGLVDAITNSEGGGDIGADRYERIERESLARIRTNPKDRVAYEELITARNQLAGLDNQYNAETDSYNAEGQADLRALTQAFEDYQKLDVPLDDEFGRVAKFAANAYYYLDNTQKYIDTQELVAEERNATGPYQQLAQAAYALGQTRKGDLAAQKAIELAPDDQRATVKQTMDQLKQQTAAASPEAAPSASATPKPKK